MKPHRIMALVLVTLAFAAPARAQFTANFQTNTISGITSNWVGLYQIGSVSINNALIITNNGVLGVGNGYLGNAGGPPSFPGSSGNSVLVTGSGAVWSNQFDVYVGNQGDNNSVTIANGGKVISGSLVRMGGSPGSDGNSVLVTGSGSVWSNRFGEFVIGHGGVNNQMTISAGGAVISLTGFLGESIGFSSHNNSVTVTGTGSIWDITDTLQVGSSGTGNTLTITNGGRVSNADGFIGRRETSSHNVVTVSGNGATWNNRGVLYVGGSGGGDTNTLNIGAGGSVIANNAFISIDPGSDGNRINVNGGSLFVTNALGTGTLDIRRGTLTFNGGIVTVDKLAVTTNNGFIVFNTGTFTSRGTMVSNSQNFVIGDTGSGGATFIANGGTHGFTNNLIVGNFSSNNRLVISNGALLVNSIGFIGSNTTATGNSVLVSGGGSVWSNRFNLVVGMEGTGNSLVISNGGKVFNNTGFLSEGFASGNNHVTVIGTGSAWNNGADLYAGESSAANTLTITNGGAVVNQTAYLGMFSSASNNVVTVSGNNAVWTSRRDLVIGFTGDTNTLNIGAGGSVIASNAVIGATDLADGNRINVTGGNLFVTNAPGNGWLDIQRGTLTASAGGSITANNLHISPTGFVSMTSARIRVTGATTNSGTFTMLHSVGTFSSVVNSGAWITDPTTNIFNSFITTESGYIAATSGDVFVFTNDASTAGHFFNRSTNSAAFNTTEAKFLFSGTLAMTQDFYAAGHNLEAVAPSSSSTNTVTGDWNVATAHNFALGTLEISNFSTVRVWDAFSGLGGEFGGTNDNLRAALYVSNLVMSANSFLIIGNNLEVYFQNSNSWGAANYTLLGSGELHQWQQLDFVAAIPEPSVALLWLVGAGTFYAARRRRHGRKPA